jgi:hypothetical protein
MRAASARHFQDRDSERGVRSRPDRPGARAQARAWANAERRRRQRHFARRRRDLLEDAGIALLLTLTLLVLTAGLGVVALLELPMAGILAASVVIPRIRRHRRRHRPGPKQR